jgi:hypothetical protein
MRGLLLAFLLSCILLLGLCAPVPAQPPAEKKDTPPAKYERDGSTMFVPYTLAAVGLIIVMILVCMPVRRE